MTNKQIYELIFFNTSQYLKWIAQTGNYRKLDYNL